MNTGRHAERSANTRDALLRSATTVFRRHGYSGTRVDEVCADAGLSKGAFFHHFASKEALAMAASERFEADAADLYEAIARSQTDPVKRLFAYLNRRYEGITEDIVDFSCLQGTLLQELYQSQPEIAQVAGQGVLGHVAFLTQIYQEALDAAGLKQRWDAEQLAIHTQAVTQGAFIMAKAANSPELARKSLRQLTQHVELIFKQPKMKKLRGA